MSRTPQSRRDHRPGPNPATSRAPQSRRDHRPGAEPGRNTPRAICPSRRPLLLWGLALALLLCLGAGCEAGGDFCRGDDDCPRGWRCSGLGDTRGVCTYPQGVPDRGPDAPLPADRGPEASPLDGAPEASALDGPRDSAPADTKTDAPPPDAGPGPDTTAAPDASPTQDAAQPDQAPPVDSAPDRTAPLPDTGPTPDTTP